MSQNDMSLANQAGAAFRSDVNSALQALASLSSGATEPSTTYAYQWWADTTTGLLKIRNAANSAWITVGTLATANLGIPALANITGLGANVATALAIAVGSAGAPVVLNGALGTPSSGTLSSCDPASDTAKGVVELAVQSEMESGTSALLAVTPGRQQYHPMHPKGYAFLKIGSGVVASAGLTSITENSAGDYTFNWNFSFSSVNYCAIATTNTQGRTCVVSAKTVNSTRVLTADTAANLEANDVNIIVLGDI